MNKRILSKTGEALYGPHWINRLADDLGMSRRTVLRYKNGERDIPDTVPKLLLKLLTRRSDVINRRILEIEQISP